MTTGVLLALTGEDAGIVRALDAPGTGLSVLRRCADLPELLSAGMAGLGRLAVLDTGIDERASALSGGNQQKVVVGKLLSGNSRILILDEPTKGVDVGSKAQIYEIMCDLTARGYGILLISSELPEVVTVRFLAFVVPPPAVWMPPELSLGVVMVEFEMFTVVPLP